MQAMKDISERSFPYRSYEEEIQAVNSDMPKSALHNLVYSYRHNSKEYAMHFLASHNENVDWDMM